MSAGFAAVWLCDAVLTSGSNCRDDGRPSRVPSICATVTTSSASRWAKTRWAKQRAADALHAAGAQFLNYYGDNYIEEPWAALPEERRPVRSSLRREVPAAARSAHVDVDDLDGVV